MSLIGIIVVIVFIIIVIALVRLVSSIVGAITHRNYMRGEPIHFNYDGRRVTAYVRSISKRGDKRYHIVVEKHH